jgi:glycosyltransferase involved in cell wall biosynthesis
MKTVFINGKFTAQRTTGVQRVASCIVAALDALLGTDLVAQTVQWVLLCPPGGALPPLRHIACRSIGVSARSLHVWEQLALPRAARGGWLINLAGSAPLLRRRQVCTFHDAAVFDVPEAHAKVFTAWYRFLFKRIGRTAPLLLTVSAFARDRLVERIGIAPERVAVMHESGEHMAAVEAAPGTLKRLGLRELGYFVAVGSANPVKNLMALRTAFAGLPKRIDAKLVIVGGANAGVFAAGDAVTASERIVEAGTLPDAALKALYGAALGLVFPSRYEGFGLPPLEAMACGCPVAASNAASLPEVCGNAALYFDPQSIDAISAAIVRLHDEPELRGQLRARGTQRALGFTWNAAARVLVERVVPLVKAGA